MNMEACCKIKYFPFLQGVQSTGPNNTLKENEMGKG